MNQQVSRNKLSQDSLPVPEQQIMMIREESEDLQKQKI